MVRVGIVGVGFMGMMHYLGYQKLKDAKVTALCSRDAKKLDGDWRGIQGNFGPPGAVMDLGDIKKYQSLDAMLEDPDLDLIDVCNPTALHPQTAIAALKAGKHVLVEKCISLKSEDADAMVQAAKEADRLLMVAHVLPYFPEFAYVRRVIHEETYGKLQGGHFRRIISKPDWSAEIGDVEKTGGPAIDLHIHDTHFIGLVAGVPNQIFSTGNVTESGAVDYLTTQYLYGEDGPAISCSSGALAQSGRPFVHGFELYLEKATLLHESGVTPLTVLTEDGQVLQPELPGGGDPVDAFSLEMQAAVDGVAKGKAPDELSGQLARDALLLCHRECESVKTGQILDV